eukprot:2888885-Pleurochrysis_carterae.AAC.2
MPRTSREWIMVEMVALVAVEAAFASAAKMRRSSLPLPLQACEYVRRAAEHVIVCKMWVIILRSVASINSGAMMYRFASSAVSGGRPLAEETGPPEAVGAPVLAAVDAAVDCACDRV